MIRVNRQRALNAAMLVYSVKEVVQKKPPIQQSGLCFRFIERQTTRLSVRFVFLMNVLQPKEEHVKRDELRTSRTIKAFDVVILEKGGDGSVNSFCVSGRMFIIVLKLPLVMHGLPAWKCGGIFFNCSSVRNLIALKVE